MQAYSNMEARAKWQKSEKKRASKKAKYVHEPRFELIETNSGNAFQLQNVQKDETADSWEVFVKSNKIQRKMTVAIKDEKVNKSDIKWLTLTTYIMFSFFSGMCFW